MKYYLFMHFEDQKFWSKRGETFDDFDQAVAEAKNIAAVFSFEIAVVGFTDGQRVEGIYNDLKFADLLNNQGDA